MYKQNEAKFYGEKEESRPSSKGSIFQKNAAHFYGFETPLHGERPFSVPQNFEAPKQAPKPVLAQRAMVNQTRDPKYEKNAEKFFGIDQEKPKNRQQLTYEQRLNRFIGY